MSRQRRLFFIDPSRVNGDRITISGSDARHITRVLRLGPGDTIRVASGDGLSHRALIETASPDAVECLLTSRETAGRAEQKAITLAQAVPKGRTMESIIRRATELGVSDIVPVETERCVSRPEGERAERRLHRWQKVAAEAAKQCSRLTVPRVAPIKTFSQLLQEPAEAELRIMLYEEEGGRGLKKALAEVKEMDRVIVLVGAEGGFTPSEAEAARGSGYITVSLGPRILRTDTASLALLTIIIYELEELEP